MMILKNEEILKRHLGGKVGVHLLRELETQEDLCIAYTPGVAEVCKAIEAEHSLANLYTAKGNLVAVVTDGTAVLGLGDIGPAASIPVMEGKAALFKRFGNLDAWPVPLDNVRVNGNTGKTDVNKFIEVTSAIAGMYGAINLEDIAAPACFEIEDKLDAILDIPVFHDDQWGTAIIVLAAVVNYCLLSNKSIEDLNIVINGAGSAGIRIADMLKQRGANYLTLLDSKGVLHKGRDDLNKHKQRFAIETTKVTLKDAMKGANIFIGVSEAGCVTADMIKSMSDFPAIFAMANPVPEIMPETVKAVMGDKPYVMATGRSDFPNQINNVLGFPYIFRGALDVRALTISMDMKIAASTALAELARLGNVPEETKKAYGRVNFNFGSDYIIPVPFDPRLLDYVSSAVSIAALKGGVSKYQKDIEVSDIYHLPDLHEMDGTGAFIKAIIKELAFDRGICYVGISAPNRDDVSYVPCDSEGVVIENDTQAYSKDIKINPEKEPGKLLRTISQHIGQARMLGIHKNGSLGNIAYLSGWCWDES